jgi:hypothetical protein
MVKRLAIGLFLGFLVGLAVAAALTHGLGITFVGSFGAIAAYVAAAATGSLVGLVTGKPIWSATGKIEAGLKAFFGALIAAGLMFVMRRWVTVDVNLSFLNAGAAGSLGAVPYAALPPISALLGAFFEIDNTPEAQEKEAAAGGSKAGNSRLRVAAGEDAEELAEDEVSDKKARRR